MPNEQVASLVDQLSNHLVVQQLRLQPFPLAEARESFDGFAEWLPCPADVKVESVSAGGVAAEWIVAPGAGEARAVLFLHGGCFVIGSVNSHRELCARISAATGCAVLLVDYRRAPEHPFPAALEDALTAYQWLMDRGIASARIVLAGDSAGGNLTVSTMVALRDRNQPLPAAGVCFSPWFDLECTGKHPECPDLILRREDLRYLGRFYLGKTDGRSPLASPLYADVRGLPPIYIQVGTAEVLLDDSHRFVERARKVGVDVKLDSWDGLFHVFQLYPMLPEATDALERMARFVTSNARCNRLWPPHLGR